MHESSDDSGFSLLFDHTCTRLSTDYPLGNGDWDGCWSNCVPGVDHRLSQLEREKDTEGDYSNFSDLAVPAVHGGGRVLRHFLWGTVVLRACGGSADQKALQHYLRKQMRSA